MGAIIFLYKATTLNLEVRNVIGFSIMMWFVTLVLFIIAVSLLRGNTSPVHGKVFDETDDKVGYAKQLGKPCVLICFGTFLSGFVTSVIKEGAAILYALLILLFVIVIAVVWFAQIQKRYKN